MTNFLLFHFFLFQQAIAKESPQAKKLILDDVGARLLPASTTLGSKIFIVENLISIEDDLQLTPITVILFLFAYFKNTI